MRYIITTSLAGIFALGVIGSASLKAASKDSTLPDPKVLSFELPAQIPWGPVTAEGAQFANLYGDPAKPGPYLVLVKWLPHHMSKPHTHRYDRFVTVLSGTWWIGTGDDWDPEKTTPMPPGSFVRHFANQVHWDGAKDEETIIEIFGIGPATSIPSPTAKLKP